MRLKLWLLAMDPASWLPGEAGFRVYLWTVRGASDATDWGPLPNGTDQDG